MDTTSLAETARTQIERARARTPGRSAHTVHGGHDQMLRQTVIALRAGETLHEHNSSREATLQVLAGWVRLTTATRTVEAVAGDLLTVPAEAHTLDAVADSAVLLSVGLVLAKPDPVAVAGNAGPDYSWQAEWN
jgi:quercetin dioxygenase-like cupin family protein